MPLVTRRRQHATLIVFLSSLNWFVDCFSRPPAIAGQRLARNPLKTPPLQSDRFKGDVDELAERINSGKAAIAGALVGSIAFAPVDLVVQQFILTGGGVGGVEGAWLPQWEFNTDQMALQGALFAVVYRYATREDQNPMLKQGVVGGFTLVRALPLVKVSAACEAIPLRKSEEEKVVVRNCGVLCWGLARSSAPPPPAICLRTFDVTVTSLEGWSDGASILLHLTYSEYVPPPIHLTSLSCSLWIIHHTVVVCERTLFVNHRITNHTIE
jgi:hypothetical protein